MKNSFSLVSAIPLTKWLRSSALLPITLSLLWAVPAQSSSVNCSNNSADSTLIQTAINAGGTVTLSGTCAMGSNTVSINNPVSITGTATLNGNQSQIFQINTSQVSINGLTFNQGFVSFGGAQSYSNFTFTNNVIQNLWSGGASGGPTGLSGPGIISSNISNNHFYNLWGGGSPGYANVAPPVNAPLCPGIQCWGSTALSFSGIDQTTISYNTFDEIGGDGMHIFWESFTGNVNSRSTSGDVIAYNTFTHIRRIPIEIQSQPAGNCPGGCNYAMTNTVGLQIKGNYVHDYTPYSYFDTWGASLVPDGAVNPQYINNTFIANPGSGYAQGYGGYAPCMESSGRNSLSQGNVCASVAGGSNSYGTGIAQGNGSNPTFSSIYQNNIFCGASNTTVLGQENATTPPSNSLMVDRYNYKSSGACPAGSNLTSSNINASFAGNGVISGGNEAWTLAVVSNLSIRYVQFFLDSGSTPVATQEISDVNNNFASDRKWMYHLTLSTASLAGGSHAITAVVTDVSGATTRVTQGAGSTSATSSTVSPVAISFGPQLVGSTASAQSITVQNTGAAALTISGMSLNSINSNDFSVNTTCSTSVAPGASCSVNTTFTPSLAGIESATLVIADSSNNSPHSVSLGGLGVAAPATNSPATATSNLSGNSGLSALPASLPSGMTLWLANDSVASPVGARVGIWKDQSGRGSDAAQANSGNQPTVVAGSNQQHALHFDGQSSFMAIPNVPISGLSGMTVFLVAAGSTDDSSAGWGLTSLLDWPETSPWGTTFFGMYGNSWRFRFGTTQFGNEDTVKLPTDMTSTFGLGEWMHSGSQDSMWLNGQSLGSFSGKSAILSGSGNSALLGMGLNSTFYCGDLSEVIVYGRALSDSERQSVETYLRAKYNL